VTQPTSRKIRGGERKQNQKLSLQTSNSSKKKLCKWGNPQLDGIRKDVKSKKENRGLNGRGYKRKHPSNPCFCVPHLSLNAESESRFTGSTRGPQNLRAWKKPTSKKKDNEYVETVK